MSNAQSATHLEPLSFLWWPERQQQFEFLLHLLCYSDLSISVEGAEGAGKTEVVKRALNRVGQDLGWVAWLDARELQQPLESQFEQLTESRTKAIPVLVIDNADALDMSDWQQVEAWLTAGQPRLLLAARKHRALERLDTRLHQIQLSPLPREQARNCWSKVYGEQIAVPATVWPGDLTRPQHAPNRQKRSLTLPKGHLMALGCIIISLCAAVYFQYRLEQAEIVKLQQSGAPVLAEKDPIDRVLMNPLAPDEGLQVPPDTRAVPTKKDQSQQGLSNSLPPDAASNNRAEIIKTEAIHKLSENALDQWMLNKQATAPAPALLEAVTSSAKEPKKPKTKKILDKTAAVVLETMNSTPLANKRSFDVALEEQKHPLLTLDSSQYVFQMLGTRSQKNAKLFIDKYQALSKNWWVYPAMFKGKPWFVVVYGPFKTREKAIQAQAHFPKTLLSQKPWLRTIKAVQEDIKDP